MIQTILDNLVRRNLKIIYIDRIFLFCHKNQLMSLDLEFHLHIFQPFIYVSIIALVDVHFVCRVLLNPSLD